MKKTVKSGFTLAEVLITLAIIGTVAALTLPNLLVNNQYKAIGVKLAKFLSTTEQATRAHAAGNQIFEVSDPQTISDFISDTYLINKVDGTEPTHAGVVRPTALDTDAPYLYLNTTGTVETDPSKVLTNGYHAELKDGTRITATICTKTEKGQTTYIDACKYDDTGRGKGIVGGRKTGEPVYAISFDPAVNGVPKSTHHNYTFVVTELGFVYPAADEACLWEIYDNGFSTTSATFNEGSACYGAKRKPDKKS